MNTTSSQYSLFLHPKQQSFISDDITSFIKELQNIHLIANPVENLKNSFFTGKRYLDYIAYMGCSPTIQFEESKTSDTFCHIKIHQYESAKLITNQLQPRPPHCPHCNKPVKNWQQNRTDEILFCNICNTSSNIADYNWRKMAGYAHLFIEITDIFPKEAVPQKILLDQLAEIFQTEWTYFYHCL